MATWDVSQFRPSLPDPCGPVLLSLAAPEFVSHAPSRRDNNLLRLESA